MIDVYVRDAREGEDVGFPRVRSECDGDDPSAVLGRGLTLRWGRRQRKRIALSLWATLRLK